LQLIDGDVKSSSSACLRISTSDSDAEDEDDADEIGEDSDNRQLLLIELISQTASTFQSIEQALNHGLTVLAQL
jgi:ACT domain-containing protein